MKIIITLLVYFILNSYTVAQNIPRDNQNASNVIIHRTTKIKLSAHEYYYKSLASFANGQDKFGLKDLSILKNKQIVLVLLYNSNAPWADVFNTGMCTKTGDETFNRLIKKYNLTITKLFVVDDDNEGLVLEQKNRPKKIVSCAKELSMIDHTLMLHLKEVPNENSK